MRQQSDSCGAVAIPALEFAAECFRDYYYKHMDFNMGRLHLPNGGFAISYHKYHNTMEKHDPALQSKYTTSFDTEELIEELRRIPG